MIGDASVELGRYRQGFARSRGSGELRPGLVAYARLSYSRELVRATSTGATRLMRRAVDAGSGAPENTQWTRVQLATLLLKSGHVDAAAKEYRHALALLPDYARAEAGLGAVAVARGNLALAESWYDRAASHLPAARHRRAARRRARGARRPRPAPRRRTPSSASRRRSSSAPAATPTSRRRSSTPRTRARGRRASVVALARKALAFRPSIYGHDSLAWALYSAGKCRQALPQAMLANRLGTIDPQLSWHLGAIAACAGKHGAGPHGAAQKALARTPHFHPLDAPAARRLLGLGAARQWTRAERQVALAASATWHSPRARRRGRRARRARSGRRRASARQLHGQPVHAPRRRADATSRCATCSTWPRSRRSSGGSSWMQRRRPHRAGRGGARARAAGRAHRAAPAAAGRRQAGAARARDARASPSRRGRAGSRRRGSTPASGRSARARRRAAHVHALGHLRDRPRGLARAARRPRRRRRGALDGRLGRRSARRRSRTTRPICCTRRPTSARRRPWPRSAPAALAVQAIPAHDVSAPDTRLELGQERRRLRLADRERRRS